MAITISGENNNDRILAADGVIDQISGFNIVGVITATTFTGNLTGNVTGNLTGNVNNTSPLLLQTGGYERLRLTGNNEIGIAGANYGSAGQVLTSGGSGSAVSWTTIPTQVTISSNANNRIITGGSGTNLVGEANLTWDGSVLSATGSDAQLRLYDSTASSENSAFRLMAYNGVNMIQSGKAFSSDSKADLVFGSMFGGTEWLRITSSGDLSLRSTTENAHLGLTANSTAINFTLGSTAGTSPRMYFYGTGNGQSNAGDIFTGTGTGGILHYRSGGLIKFEVNSDNTTAEALRISSNGQISTRGATGTSFNNAGAGDFGSFLTINGGHTSNQWGILSLEGNTSANGYAVGAIQFINQNNANGSSGGSNQSRLLAKIDVSSVTSDSNAGDDSGGILQFFTKPEAGIPTQRLLIKSGGTIAIPGQGASNANPRLLIEDGHGGDNDFSISQYEDANGTYTLIGQNVQLDANGNETILDSNHKTASIYLDARNNGALFFNTGGTNTHTEKLRITSGGRVLINSSAVVNTDDFLTIRRPLGNHAVTSMTLDATNTTGTYANAFILTKAKNYYYNGLVFTSSDGHQGGIAGKMTQGGGSTPQIDVRVGGSSFNQSDTLAMTIHNDGYVTKPAHPSFHARLINHTNATANPLVFDDVIVNVGSHYKSSGSDAGKFVAPIAGTYFFFWEAIKNSTTSVTRLYLMKNGNKTYNNMHLRLQEEGLYANGCMNVIMTLAEGDKIHINLTVGGVHAAEYSHFGGYLIG